jgi:hypothetical protein
MTRLAVGSEAWLVVASDPRTVSPQRQKDSAFGGSVTGTRERFRNGVSGSSGAVALGDPADVHFKGSNGSALE